MHPVDMLREAAERTREEIEDLRERRDHFTHAIAALAEAHGRIQAAQLRKRAVARVTNAAGGIAWADIGEGLSGREGAAAPIRTAITTYRTEIEDLENHLATLEHRAEGLTHAIAAIIRLEAGDA